MCKNRVTLNFNSYFLHKVIKIVIILSILKRRYNFNFETKIVFKHFFYKLEHSNTYFSQATLILKKYKQ